MTAIYEPRPMIERPGFKYLLLHQGREIDQLKAAEPKVREVGPPLDFGDMATDLAELAHRERMAFPWLADNECGTCGELECDCWRGTLSADASRETSTFEGSTT